MADLHFDKALSSLVESIGEVTEEQLLEIGHFAQTIILARTKHGLDVDGHQFEPYSEAYAAERTKRGLQTKPDLVRTGHMLGALGPSVTGHGEVSVLFNSAREATKAAAHNYGVSAAASVKAHSRSVYTDSKGRRASGAEIMRDKRRKKDKRRLSIREEKVGAHSRDMKTPQREFMDVRMPHEMDAIAEAIGQSVLARIEKAIE